MINMTTVLHSINTLDLAAAEGAVLACVPCAVAVEDFETDAAGRPVAALVAVRAGSERAACASVRGAEVDSVETDSAGAIVLVYVSIPLAEAA
jgi:hypothetical protein